MHFIKIMRFSRYGALVSSHLAADHAARKAYEAASRAAWAADRAGGVCEKAVVWTSPEGKEERIPDRVHPEW